MPHSDIHGSTPARGSPWLFAACHVLHRLLVPRHPPNALLALEIASPGSTRGTPPCTETILSRRCSAISNQDRSRSPPASHQADEVPAKADLFTQHTTGSCCIASPAAASTAHRPKTARSPKTARPTRSTRSLHASERSRRAAGRRATHGNPVRLATAARPETHQNLIYPDKEPHSPKGISQEAAQTAWPSYVYKTNHADECSLLRDSRNPCLTTPGGDDRIRTDDPLLAKQVLSQLSYVPSRQARDTQKN